MKKFAAFLMILSVSVFTMGCGGGTAKKKSGTKAPAAKKTPAKKGAAKSGGSDKKAPAKKGSSDKK